MKRTLLIVLSILAILLAPAVQALAKTNRIPHENPAFARATIDKAALLLAYANLFQRASDGRYAEASAIMADIKGASIPDGIRNIFDRYNSVIQDLVAGMDQMEKTLDQASEYLADSQLEDARQSLDEASGMIPRLEALFQEQQDGTNALVRQLGIAAVSGFDPAMESYDRLNQSTRRLRDLLQAFKLLLSQMTNQRRQAELNLTETQIVLSPDRSEVFVGDTVIISGALTGGGRPLPGREVAVLFDNIRHTVLPDANGRFQVSLEVPYRYVRSMDLQAEYTPAGQDINLYQGARTGKLKLGTLFYDTSLLLSGPDNAYPGLPLVISGQATSGPAAPERRLRVLLDDRLLAEKAVSSRIDIEVTVPADLATGRHQLTVAIEPRGRFTGAEWPVFLEVVKMPVQADIQVPGFAILPAALPVRGSLHYGDRPVAGGSVSASTMGRTYSVRSADDGSFAIDIDDPLYLSLVSRQEITIGFNPGEPWYEGGQVRKSVLVLNPVNTGLLALILALALLVTRRSRSQTPARVLAGNGEAPPDPSALSESENGISRPEPRPDLPLASPHPLSGHAREVWLAYAGGLAVIAAKTGMVMQPQSTIQEYFDLTSPVLSPITRDLFSEFGQLAEAALYSEQALGPAHAARADLLAESIEKDLRSATP